MIGLTDEQKVEKQITESIAEICYFRLTKSKLFYACEFCGRRFALHYSGKGVNERMQEHFAHHLKTKGIT